MKNKHFLLMFLFFSISSLVNAQDISLKISKKYLNIPVSHKEERAKMSIESGKKTARQFIVRLATSDPDYWVFCDMSEFKGKTIKISYEGNAEGLSKIYQADEIEGQANLYKEENRPQLHFSTRRGWINDPNGLIYHDGEYHLFYQHNPYERDWENMHWGHAVSSDMIHWQELPVALYPDHLGTMFSGSAVIDYNNTSGFGTKNKPAMVAAYTAFTSDRQVQCMAYSNDKGRTWTKYKDNPVIDSKEKWNSVDTRDPKMFWYEKNGEKGHWVMVLNERDGHSIYTSNDLKDWKYESHTAGFWECPELFELPIDGDVNNTKWVMYGASGTYMIGSFDGKVFTPEHGKYYFSTGVIYAAQSFSNIPDADGRRIQMGWGRVDHPNMPFRHMMLLPTELSLRSTKDGVRLFSNPIKEAGKLQEAGQKWTSLNEREANEAMKQFIDSDYLRIKVTLHLSHATDAGLNLFGQHLLRYDMNSNLVNGVFYSPEDMTSMEITADIIVDKTSVEVFIDGGAYSYALQRNANADNREGFRFFGNNIEIKKLEVYPMKSIWHK